MSILSTANLIAADKRHCWHPFTAQSAWCDPGHEPLVLVEGEGALLRDSEGREYIDGNSSIWTNLHGHRHPKINAAIREQLERVAHVSFLGYTHPTAVQLAEELVALWPQTGERPFTRVFFSDDGATAVEVAIKLAVQAWQHRDQPRRTRFLAFTSAYHGDTLGASSLGGIRIFHERFSAFHFPCEHVASMEELRARTAELEPESLAAVIIEPLIQGAGGMRLWPEGMLAELRAWCDEHGVFLITDEVMTAFGRTGAMFASQKEGVQADFTAVAKGLTGGYTPLAATFTTEAVYESFLSKPGEDTTFYYGHSYTAHPLGCAAALANLAIFREEATLEHLAGKIRHLAAALERLKGQAHIGDIRQCGFMVGIDVKAAPGQQQTGARVCQSARRHGLLTRPVRDTLVLMPPYCVTEKQIDQCVYALSEGVREVCGEG